jgi:hypothetical protein
MITATTRTSAYAPNALPTTPKFRITYAIAPPNQSTPVERRRTLAGNLSARLAALPIDALLVYDVQDEAARTDVPRPFPFVHKVDPLTYALDLELGVLPVVVYHAVAQQDEASLCRWLDVLHARNAHAVLVGAPSRQTASPLTLSQAMSACRRHAPGVSFGGVVIPERHRAAGDEDARVWAKTQNGCGFFVSQTVWSVSASRLLISDLHARAEAEGRAVPPILFTFSPCGSAQTLRFLEWLGVDVPRFVKRELSSARDMLERSIELAAEAAAEIRAYAEARGLLVGCNIESVSSRAAEVDASFELLRRIDQLDRRPDLRSAALLTT